MLSEGANRVSEQYRVLTPCAYVVDGAAIHHREAGALVFLTPELAAELGYAVEPTVRSSRPPTLHTVRRKKQVVEDEDG
jgi:hypothetical protein